MKSQKSCTLRFSNCLEMKLSDVYLNLQQTAFLLAADFVSALCFFLKKSVRLILKKNKFTEVCRRN